MSANKSTLNVKYPKEVQEAKRAYEIAQNHLDMADTPELIDAAIYELNAARIRLGVAIKAAGEEVENGRRQTLFGPGYGPKEYRLGGYRA